MNYLAHAFLSPSDPQILLGNLAGDSVRGVNTDALPAGIRLGLDLHELIDATTDASPGFRELRRLIDAAELPYAGVLADLLIDYALAAQWESRATEEFDDFRKRVYGILDRGAGLVSPRFYFTAAVLVGEDWFESYRTAAGMETAFRRLGRRARRPLPMGALMRFLVSREREIRDLGGGVLKTVAERIEKEHTL